MCRYPSRHIVPIAHNLAADTQQDNQQINTIGNTVAQQASQTGQRLIDRELNIQPTIHIRAGMEFNVLVNKDLILAPYKPVRIRR